MNKKSTIITNWWSWVFLWVVIYLISHVVSLTRLPVFADEAIYTRWAQLMMDDFHRYAFFPLNDGKTPLFIWMLVPFQYVIKDPLFAARIVSVIGGAVQLVLSMSIVRELKGNKLAQGIAAFFVIVLPYWFLHHRMALMDGWLAVWITLASLAVINLNSLQVSFKVNNGNFLAAFFKGCLTELKRLFSISGVWFWIGGLAIGAGMFTKIPALLGVLSLFVLIALPPLKDRITLFIRSWRVLMISVMGGAIFLTLKASAAFSQLANRGSDFLYPLGDVLLKGAWQETLINTPNYFWYYWVYLTPGVIVLLIASILEKKLRRKSLVLVLAGLAFMAPIDLLGRVVYPRYLLPSVIYFTLAASLSAAFYLERAKQKISEVGVAQQFMLALVVIILLQQIVTPALSAAIYAWTDVDHYPFVEADKEQYLTEWSSGHGVKEFVDLLQSESKSQKIYVATEGYFGTLPDGALMYLHNQDVSHISLEGVGQPINQIPPILSEKISDFDQVWLLANSHRIKFYIPEDYLITEYCRPENAPCLQVWDMSELVSEEN